MVEHIRDGHSDSRAHWEDWGFAIDFLHHPITKLGGLIGREAGESTGTGMVERERCA